MRRRLILGALSAVVLAALPLTGWAATGPSVTLLTPASESVHRGVVSITWSYSGFHSSTPVDVQVRRGNEAYQLLARVPIDNGTPGLLGSTSWSTSAADDAADWTVRLIVPTNKSVTSSASPVVVDNTAPVPELASRTPANGAGWNNGDVTVTWACTDATSGPVEATVSDTVSDEGIDQIASATCEDRAGNTAQATEGDIDIDKTPGTASIDVEPVAEGGPTASANEPITGTAADALSGVGSVAVTFTDALDGATTRTADCTGCGTGSATWSVATAGLAPGLYTVSAVATDVAGNDSEPATAAFVVVAEPVVTPPNVQEIVDGIVGTLPDPQETIDEVVGTLPNPDDVIGTLPNPDDVIGTLPNPDDIIGTPPTPQEIVDGIVGTLPNLQEIVDGIIGTVPDPTTLLGDGV
jgi:hypothetical protein